MNLATLSESYVHIENQPVKNCKKQSNENNLKGVGEMAFTLEDAIIMASRNHAGQTDKLGEPYILHPVRVMSKLSDPAARIVAVLHDVIEDTTVTIDEIRNAGASKEIIDALLVLTKDEDRDYEQYLRAVRANPLARMVKLADIEDNEDPGRLNKLPKETRKRLQKKYSKAREELSLPYEKGTSIVLYHGKGNGCNTYVDAFIEKNNGNLMVEGQMIFTGGDSEFGDSDSEYWLTISKADKDQLLLKLLSQYFGDASGFSSFKTFCDENKIEYKFFSC